MGRHRPMPKRDDGQVDLPILIKQLAGDGARVAEAEIALARAEVAIIMRRYAAGVAVGTCAFTVAITAFVILAQAGALALVPYVVNPVYAYLSVALLLGAFTIILSLVAAHMFLRKHVPVGTILSWLIGKGEPK